MIALSLSVAVSLALLMLVEKPTQMIGKAGLLTLINLAGDHPLVHLTRGRIAERA